MSTMARRNAERREPVTSGTGNVFADLGFPDAAERQARLRLAYALNQVLQERKFSQADANQDAGNHTAQGVIAPRQEPSGLRARKVPAGGIEVALASAWLAQSTAERCASVSVAAQALTAANRPNVWGACATASRLTSASAGRAAIQEAAGHRFCFRSYLLPARRRSPTSRDPSPRGRSRLRLLRVGRDGVRGEGLGWEGGIGTSFAASVRKQAGIHASFRSKTASPSKRRARQRQLMHINCRCHSTICTTPSVMRLSLRSATA